MNSLADSLHPQAFLRTLPIHPVTGMPLPAPPRVADSDLFVGEPPPAPSERLVWWLARIARGWQPSRRVRSLGASDSAHYFGIYSHEYREVLEPALLAAEREAARRAESPTP